MTKKPESHNSLSTLTLECRTLSEKLKAGYYVSALVGLVITFVSASNSMTLAIPILVATFLFTFQLYLLHLGFRIVAEWLVLHIAIHNNTYTASKRLTELTQSTMGVNSSRSL